MYYEKFDQPILAKFGVYKWKPLSSFSFRKLHRALIEFHDYELQQKCCELAGVQSVKDELSFGYCCFDEQLGLQFYILGACNRDGKSLDWWVSVPEGKEIVLSYDEAKDKMISLSDSYPVAITKCLSRCRQLMEKHEKNPTIMLQELDKFRSMEFPLDIRITIPAESEAQETVLFRPTELLSSDFLRGYLLEDPRSNTELHAGDILDVKLIRNEYRRVVAVTQYLPTTWISADNGNWIGKVGSEGGIVLEDDEYAGQCRITLEDCTHHFTITCGIYGSMMHTAFCGKERAYALYDEMKQELQYICDTCNLDSPTDVDDFYELIDDFVSRY